MDDIPLKSASCVVRSTLAWSEKTDPRFARINPPVLGLNLILSPIWFTDSIVTLPKRMDSMKKVWWKLRYAIHRDFSTFSLQVGTSDVLRLIGQFLKECNLNKSKNVWWIFIPWRFSLGITRRVRSQYWFSVVEQVSTGFNNCRKMGQCSLRSRRSPTCKRCSSWPPWACLPRVIRKGGT